MNSNLDINTNTGSSSNDEPVFVIVGKFRRPHGIKGEIRMTPLTDFPEILKPGISIFVGDRYQSHTLNSIRWHGGDLLVSLVGLPDRTSVEIFRNVMVYMKEEDLPETPEGEYYLHQLVGLRVITDEDQELGKIKEIIVTGANDVYLIETEGGKDILLPAIDEVVVEINQTERYMLVHIIPGLLDI